MYRAFQSNKEVVIPENLVGFELSVKSRDICLPLAALGPSLLYSGADSDILNEKQLHKSAKRWLQLWSSS